LNKIIFKKINESGIKASKDLAIEFGEPEWCFGSGQRHSHVFAVAPTISNATIMGTSYSIEPMVANIFAQISAKGTFIRTNPQFETFMLDKYPEHYTAQVKDSIIENMGSVAHLDFLTPYEKSIFLTAYEINQKDLISQAADRQPYICQAQSVNLFIRENADDSPTIKNNWMREIHYHAWEKGLKTLYYLRADVANKGDMASNANKSGCSMCEG
jgi:ribonucleoside-diphosphate reductase alpha chain